MPAATTLLPPEKPLYTIREAHETLGISERKLLYLFRAGELRRVKLGRLTLVRRDDLEALIAKLPDAPRRPGKR
jgi:excisionase family DNA binding protein